jgi:hypothetical protein
MGNVGTPIDYRARRVLERIQKRAPEENYLPSGEGFYRIECIDGGVSGTVYEQKGPTSPQKLGTFRITATGRIEAFPGIDEAEWDAYQQPDVQKAVLW